MKQISSVDLFYLTQELKILEQQRIDNFYFQDGIFYMRVYVRGKGHQYLTNKVSKYLYLSSEKDEVSEPSNFIQYLRKYLRNGFVTQVEQVGFERILRVTIEKKQDEEVKIYQLYLELFANGNIVLCDHEDTIKNSLEKRKFKDRDVLVHRTYELPPGRPFSLLDFDPKLVGEEMKTSDLSLVKFLALKFGLGGKFSEEVCHLSKSEKSTLVTELDKKQIKSITDQLSELLTHKLNPQILYKDEQVADFTPFPLKSLSLQEKALKTFNEVLRTYFEEFKEDVDKREEQFEKDLQKLQKRLQKLQDQKDQVEKDYEKFNGYGNIIYENYAAVEELLNSINSVAKEKGWEYVLEKVKTEEQLKKLVKKVNYKNNEIILNL